MSGEVVASLVAVPADVGYAGVFALVAAETAGALVPGETALILAGALAARGDLSLGAVIAAGAAGAVVGDNIGFLVGARGVRFLLTWGSRWQAERRQLVAEAERFFAKHGAKAVLFARWMPGVRLVGAWFAGAARMSWPKFFLWNSVGGIAWSASVAGGAYVLGSVANWAFGLIGIIVSLVVIVIAGTTLGRRRLARASFGRCDSSH